MFEINETIMKEVDSTISANDLNYNLPEKIDLYPTYYKEGITVRSFRVRCLGCNEIFVCPDETHWTHKEGDMFPELYCKNFTNPDNYCDYHGFTDIVHGFVMMDDDIYPDIKSNDWVVRNLSEKEQRKYNIRTEINIIKNRRNPDYKRYKEFVEHVYKTDMWHKVDIPLWK
tara:strand:+ start:441 stop:953 length:513 start_codon:yes stop_codon:yes gene_type:complete